MSVETSASSGFYMPAEWAQHEGTWLQRPHNDRYEANQLWLNISAWRHEVLCHPAATSGLWIAHGTVWKENGVEKYTNIGLIQMLCSENKE